MSKAFHRRFLDLVDAVERDFAVMRWHGGDVPIWPLARMELHLDMHFASMGIPRAPAQRFPWRSVARAGVPVRNAWRSRRDLPHFVARPQRADVMVLGDGVSLDRIDGAWRDRFAEPVIAALQDGGKKSLLMQSGDLNRLPWQRATYAANNVAARGAQLAAGARIEIDLPEHDAVIEFLSRHGVHAPSLARDALQLTATRVSATATAFEEVLDIVAPSLAFVVNYYSGLGPAFVLGCRRRGVLSVDLQHCPQEGAHKAYCFSTVPTEGYAVLPDVFWSWSEREAAHVRRSVKDAAPGRHRAIHGGHTQMAALNDDGKIARHWDAALRARRDLGRFDQEILVALQPLGGHGADWDALRACMDAAPPTWRWWIRRHPAASPSQDEEYASLLVLDRPNVEVAAASAVPLPVLLRHMTALVSLASGAAAEAAAFGVPAFFLCESARDTFAELIGRGAATVVAADGLNAALAAHSGVGPSASRSIAPHETAGAALADALRQVQAWARQLGDGFLAGRFQPYNFTLPNRYPWLFSFARVQLGQSAPLRVLSFGCSRGDEVFTLRDYFPRAHVRGIDVDPRNIAECNRRLAPAERDLVSFAVAPNTLGEPDACYDAIFCLAVLCCGDLTTGGALSSAPRLHFEDFERVISDFARCLKPGGLLLLHTTNFRFSDAAVAAQFETVLHATPQQMAPDYLYGRDNRRIADQPYYAVAFHKRHYETATSRRNEAELASSCA